jgi:hypothetical protein
MGLRDWLAQHHDAHADREVAQGAGDPIADRAVAMSTAADVVGHQVAEYRQGLEVAEDHDEGPATRGRERHRDGGVVMEAANNVQIEAEPDDTPPREMWVEVGPEPELPPREMWVDDHETGAGADDDHRRQLGMGIG